MYQLYLPKSITGRIGTVSRASALQTYWFASGYIGTKRRLDEGRERDLSRRAPSPACHISGQLSVRLSYNAKTNHDKKITLVGRMRTDGSHTNERTSRRFNRTPDSVRMSRLPNGFQCGRPPPNEAKVMLQSEMRRSNIRFAHLPLPT